MAQGTVCNGQYTGTAVMASGDGSGWGSSSGCENQGSCARQGPTVDTGDSGCGKGGSVPGLSRNARTAMCGSVRAQSCRPLASAGGGSGYGSGKDWGGEEMM